jgi:hypothetical protein
MNGTEALANLPLPVMIGIGILIGVQLGLDVVAFMDLYKRPVDQVTFGNKWIWVAIILLINTIGAIVYLFVGRKPATMSEALPSAPAATRASDAADVLYGAPTDSDRR